jgi:hypothetical protein
MTNEPQPEIKEEVQPEAEGEPKPKAEGEAPSNLTPQIVKRVHELYEELGRESIRAVEYLEKAKQQTRKDEATVLPESEAPAEPGKTMTNESEPEAKSEPKPIFELKEASKPTAKNEPAPVSKVEAKPEAATGTKKTITQQHKKWLIIVVVILLIAGLGIAAWQIFGKDDKNKGLVSGNGRIEAVEIDVAAKTPGRIKDILAHEGELVTAGQVVALMDTEVLMPSTGRPRRS